MIASLALSAPIPALSKKVPMTESLPIRKWTKSSTINARTAITATMASTFNFPRSIALSAAFSPATSFFIPLTALANVITARKAPATTARIFRTFPNPPSLSTIPLTTPIPFCIPFFKVSAIRPSSGRRRFTRAWNRSNALVILPVSPVSSWTFFVAPCTRDIRNFNTITAGWRKAFPVAACKSVTDCLRFPNWFVQVSASLAACPNAPEALLASSTIFKRVNCFSASDKALNDFLYSSFAAAFLVVSVADKPRAASFS